MAVSGDVQDPAATLMVAGSDLLAYPRRMVYTKSDKRFITGLVLAIVAALTLLHACEQSMSYRPAYIDDGSDYPAEVEEFHDSRGR